MNGLKSTKPSQAIPCDVIVIGAGIAGLAVAHVLTGLKLRVAIVDKSSPFAGESGHAQGYIHFGGAYRAAGERFSAFATDLYEGAIAWQELLSSARFDPEDVWSRSHPVYYAIAAHSASILEDLSGCLSDTAQLNLADSPESKHAAGISEHKHNEIFQLYQLMDKALNPLDIARQLAANNPLLAFFRGDVAMLAEQTQNCSMHVEWDTEGGVAKGQLNGKVAVLTIGRAKYARSMQPGPQNASNALSHTVVLVGRPSLIEKFRPINIHLDGIIRGNDDLAITPNKIWVASHSDPSGGGYWLVSASTLEFDRKKTPDSSLGSRISTVQEIFCDWFGLKRNEIVWTEYRGDLSKPKQGPVNRWMQHSDLVTQLYVERLTLAMSTARDFAHGLRNSLTDVEISEPWPVHLGLPLQSIMNKCEHTAANLSH